MRIRYVTAWLAMVGCLVPGVAIAQQASEQWTATRSETGYPDLQGVWDYRTITPLERPAEFTGKEVLTEEEVAAVEQQAAERVGAFDLPPPPGSVGGYNRFWFDRGSTVVGDKRTSLIVDPPDGRFPSLQPGVRWHVDVNAGSEFAPIDTEFAPAVLPMRLRAGGIPVPAGPEERGLAERCLLGLTGPPMISTAYNNNIQIFQNTDYVVILNEMVHDIRKVILDGRPHLPRNIRQWMGDSRGRWEGETLVVETTNFTGKMASFSPNPVSWVGSGETLRLVERFTRVDEDTIVYEFTVDDPATFTRPFTAVSTLSRNENPIFEYACHEGNYGLLNVLRGARAAEAQARESEQE